MGMQTSRFGAEPSGLHPDDRGSQWTVALMYRNPTDYPEGP